MILRSRHCHGEGHVFVQVHDWEIWSGSIFAIWARATVVLAKGGHLLDLGERGGGATGVGPGMADKLVLNSGTPSGDPVKMTLLSHVENSCLAVLS